MKATATRMMLKLALLGASASLLLSGCAYDYLAHTDRVGYSAGDAVRANIARETTDPSRRSVRNVTGLGKNGIVATPDAAGSSDPSLTQ